tara:strand:- start:9080 stop:9844 length:765 start_codon:yes stop_codon:yes gene_type:complete
MRSVLFTIFGIFALSILPLSVSADTGAVDSNVSEGVEQVANNESVDAPPNDVVLTQEEIITGLKEILRIGTEKAVAKLAVKDGFNKNFDVRIALPQSLKRVRISLNELGNVEPVETLELRMNRSAEGVTPLVAGYFIMGINQLKFKDAEKILDGQNDAATEYLRKKMEAGLAKVVRPHVKKEMMASGTYGAYNYMMDQYRRIPFVPNVRGDVEDHMVKGIMDALFLYIAREETLVRTNPDARPTEPIIKLFTKT